MARVLAPWLLLAAACGDLEADRICANPPCRVPGQPALACQQYLSCCTKVSGASSCSSSTFGSYGTCWVTTQAAADACTTACRAANDSYQSTGLGADAGCKF